MKTKKENSATKEKLLQEAKRLMLAKGFAATSVDEICQAAGLSKGSFFHYFKSKEDLAKAVLEHFFTLMVWETMGAIMQESEPIKRINAYFDFIIAHIRKPDIQYGCLIGNFAQTLSETHPEIRELCNTYFNQWIEIIKLELDQAKQAYAPDEPIDTRDLAKSFIAMHEGSLILAVSSRNMDIAVRNYELFRQYIMDLFAKNAGSD